MFQPESVAGIVFSKDESSVLLIQRRDVPVWVLPGGGIDEGETPEDAIEREILEETGYEVKIFRPIGYYHPINRLSKKTILYECRVVKGDAKTSNETKNVAFVSLENLPKMPPPYLEWIEDGLKKTKLIERKLFSVNYLTLIKYLFTHPLFVFRFFLARIGMPWNR